MAEPGATADDDDYDVKDEELVDFEGSDYGFESGGEEEVEEAQTATATLLQPPFPVDDAEAAKAQEDDTSPKVVKVVVLGDPLKLHKHPKPDLEDGELDDAAMPEGSDPEAVANGGDDDEDENDRRDRKRRKDRYAAERQFDNKERRRDSDEAHSRQYQRRGSDRMHSSQRNNYSRGSKSVAPFQRGNSGPGIMGPGRPPVSMEYGGHLSLRSMGRGYPRPVAGMVAPGRLNQNEIQNHNLAVQSHLLRQHQMAQEQVQAHAQAQAQAQAQVQARVQAHAQVEAHAYAHAHAQAQQAHAHAHAHAQAQVHMANAGALRASISGSTMRPVMGIELVGGQVQGSHGLMHLQVQKPDSGPQGNYPRALEVIGTRADLAGGRGSVGGLLLNQPSNRDRAAAGRQLTAWAPSSGIHHEISNMPAAQRRAQGQGRGQVMSPLWGEQAVGGIPTGYPVLGHAVPVNNASPGGVVPLRTPKRQGSLPIMTPNHTSTTRENANMKNVEIRPQVDGTWRTNGSNSRGTVRHHSETLAPYSRNNSAVWSKSSAGGQSGNKRSRENGTDRRHSSKSVPNSNGMGTAGNHLIQLGGPVTKSRVLSVSGFPENTSMAVVVEAFEKQGKILDFKKDEKGNAFHITFSNVSEAVSAKRSLHRTLLNGSQITVDYTVQRY